MKTYIVIAIANFPAGTVFGLDAKQAAARQYALDTIKPAGNQSCGVYRATAPMQFKVGETIQLETDPPKALADEVVTVKEADRRQRQAEDAKEPSVKMGKKARAGVQIGVPVEAQAGTGSAESVKAATDALE